MYLLPTRRRLLQAGTPLRRLLSSRGCSDTQGGSSRQLQQQQPLEQQQQQQQQLQPDEVNNDEGDGS